MVNLFIPFLYSRLVWSTSFVVWADKLFQEFGYHYISFCNTLCASGYDKQNWYLHPLPSSHSPLEHDGIIVVC
jgi:hypothetical protein